LAIRKKEILPFSTTWLDFEAITLTEISLIEKDKYCMVSLICEIKKKKKRSQNHRNSRRVVAKGWGVGRNEERLVKGTNFQL